MRLPQRGLHAQGGACAKIISSILSRPHDGRRLVFHQRPRRGKARRCRHGRFQRPVRTSRPNTDGPQLAASRLRQLSVVSERPNLQHSELPNSTCQHTGLHRLRFLQPTARGSTASVSADANDRWPGHPNRLVQHSSLWRFQGLKDGRDANLGGHHSKLPPRRDPRDPHQRRTFHR